jgi:Zn-dependent peptidase ImmA (M78 family)
VKVKAFRIPKAIIIPGLLVAVRQVSPTHEALSNGDGTYADATWDYDTDHAVISVRKNATIRRKRYLVWHELGHVLWDLMHDVRDNHKHVVDTP